jgi:hypothetical protein
MNKASGQLAAYPFLSIPNVYNTNGEAGFTAVVFHPQYATNGRLFVVLFVIPFFFVSASVYI